MVGRSGTGKTTLLRVLAGYSGATTGRSACAARRCEARPRASPWSSRTTTTRCCRGGPSRATSRWGWRARGPAGAPSAVDQAFGAVGLHDRGRDIPGACPAGCSSGCRSRGHSPWTPGAAHGRAVRCPRRDDQGSCRTSSSTCTPRPGDDRLRHPRPRRGAVPQRPRPRDRGEPRHDRDIAPTACPGPATSSPPARCPATSRRATCSGRRWAPTVMGESRAPSGRLAGAARGDRRLAGPRRGRRRHLRVPARAQGHRKGPLRRRVVRGTGRPPAAHRRHHRSRGLPRTGHRRRTGAGRRTAATAADQRPCHDRRAAHRPGGVADAHRVAGAWARTGHGTAPRDLGGPVGGRRQHLRRGAGHPEPATTTSARMLRLSRAGTLRKVVVPAVVPAGWSGRGWP